MISAVINPQGTGNFGLIDLPVPYEPVIVDLDKPLEDQLCEPCLSMARRILDE